MGEANGISSKGGMTLAVIGCGTMAGAILSGVLSSCAKTTASGGIPKISKFIATVNSVKSATSLRERFLQYSEVLEIIQGDNVKAMQDADILLLGFKPYMLDEVLKVEGAREAIGGKLVISVLVGTPLEKLEAAIYHDCPRGENEAPFFYKRAMPNIGAAFNQSMTVLETTKLSSFNEEMSDWIFLQVGKIAPVAPELFDIGGALAGASGALLAVAFDGVLDGAVSQGLKRSEATKILTQSLVSLATLLENGEHPAVLREKTASPKGTTIAGLLALEEHRARYAYSQATIAVVKRGIEIQTQK